MGERGSVEEARVELGDSSYSVFIGESLLERACEIVGGGFRRAALITDTNVSGLYAGGLESGLRRSGTEVTSALLEPGEGSKDSSKALELLDWMLSRDLSRHDLVVALGGGVVGDLAGFVASVYKRGVPLLQVPTTLLAQVDSAIGGKTAINLPGGKNMVGTFHQPIAVMSDVGTLKTLPPREYASGLAEVAKYSFLWPREWEGGLEREAGPLLSVKQEALVAVVSTCARLKAAVVSADELDTGQRAVLNYGHTLGHALEAVTGYSGAYTHGEAIAVGMVFAALVSEESGLSTRGLADRHRAVLGALGLPVAPRRPAPDFDHLLDFMLRDKKSTGDLTFVLMESEGVPALRRGLEGDLLRGCYELMLGGS